MFTQPSPEKIASTYAGNPAPLARKVDQDKKQNGGIPKDLRQLMALNDIAQGKNAAGIQQALQIPTNMPTVAQATQQRAQQALQARMMEQAREQQRLQQKPPTVPEGTPQPDDQPQGIDALPANVGEEYAKGGIIPHFNGTTDNIVIDPMLGTMQDTTPPKDDLTFLERIGVFNPENRRANERTERLLREREQKDSKKSETERGGRLPDPRASQFNIPDIPTQVKEAALAAAAKEQAAAKPATRVNAPEAPGIVSALPPAQTEAYKKLTDMMNQDPEAKAKALRDRYMKEVGARDLSIYDKTAAELEARKQKLNAPKAGYDAMMEYLENIAASGGRTSAEAGSRGAARQRQQQLGRETQQNEIMDKILELGAKKSEAQFAEKKSMFDLTQKEREDIFKKAFDAAKSVNSSDDEAKRIAAQAVENEKNRQNQIRAAQIGAQDRDNLMSRARALMAADPTKKMTIEQAMQRAAEIAATGQISAAETRANTEADKTRAKIREKYAWVDMLPANDPTGIAMRKERDKALAAVGSGAGLPDAVTSTGGPTSSNVRSQADAIISGGR